MTVGMALRSRRLSVSRVDGDGRTYTAFVAVFDGRSPSQRDVEQAQSDAGYLVMGYGPPTVLSVHQFNGDRDPRWVVVFRCCGSCD